MLLREGLHLEVGSLVLPWLMEMGGVPKWVRMHREAALWGDFADSELKILPHKEAWLQLMAMSGSACLQY